MHERYQYRTVTLGPEGWAGLAGALGPDLAHGVWRAEIGAPANELAVLTADGVAFPDGVGRVDSCIDIEATARPVAPARLDEEPGVYAHRWFHVAAGDWDEFLELSTAGWVGFEGGFPGTSIRGLFVERASEAVKALLITRYANLDAWERSRSESGGAGEEPFRRRRLLTTWTIVRTYRPVPR